MLPVQRGWSRGPRVQMVRRQLFWLPGRELGVERVCAALMYTFRCELALVNQDAERQSAPRERQRENTRRIIIHQSIEKSIVHSRLTGLTEVLGCG